MADSKRVFCANCQEVTYHSLVRDPFGEAVLTCQTSGCGRFVKLPAGITTYQGAAWLAKRELHNRGQKKVPSQNLNYAATDAFIKEFADK